MACHAHHGVHGVHFFLFHLSYFCLFCLLLLPYYVVNKVEYNGTYAKSVWSVTPPNTATIPPWSESLDEPLALPLQKQKLGWLSYLILYTVRSYLYLSGQKHRNVTDRQTGRQIWRIYSCLHCEQCGRAVNDRRCCTCIHQVAALTDSPVEEANHTGRWSF